MAIHDVNCPACGSKLRIYVQVPEPYAAVAKPGLEAQLKFSEQQGKAYTATLVRTSNALDPGLRTLQVELQLDNAERELFPGAYAEVQFKLAGNAQSLRLPANTVLFRSPGLQVAIVDAHRRIQLKSIVEVVYSPSSRMRPMPISSTSNVRKTSSAI